MLELFTFCYKNEIWQIRDMGPIKIASFQNGSHLKPEVVVINCSFSFTLGYKHEI